MRSRLLIAVLFFTSLISSSAQMRLGPVPRIINRADNYYYELDSLFLGEEYSNIGMLGFAMITTNAFDDSRCLRPSYDYEGKKAELVYQILSREEWLNRKKNKVTTYRCPISEDILFELFELVADAVLAAAVPGGPVYGADGVTYEFLVADSQSAACWSPQLQPESNCARLVSLFGRIEIAVQGQNSVAIEELRPEIQELTKIFKGLIDLLGG